MPDEPSKPQKRDPKKAGAGGSAKGGSAKDDPSIVFPNILRNTRTVPATASAFWSPGMTGNQIFSSESSGMTVTFGPVGPSASYTSGPVVRGERERELEQQISHLKQETDALQKRLLEQQQQAGEERDTVEQLKQTVAELQEKETQNFILHRIHPDARKSFLESKEFREEFLSPNPRPAFVMAVDLRRSTELMLKSRRPKLFAEFITGLCTTLGNLVLMNHGVFDKFTGDGILAFFPEFYSGTDAGYYAMTVADACHRVFAEHYRAHYSSFHTVIKDVGLGIGVDYGEIHLINIGQELAIVGTPVVYACRMAGTSARTTLVNQQAYEPLHEKYSLYCSFTEGEIDVKHEGAHLGYHAHLSQNSSYTPTQPAWLKYSKEVEAR